MPELDKYHMGVRQGAKDIVSKILSEMSLTGITLADLELIREVERRFLNSALANEPTEGNTI
jgi:hypothetical protein